MSIRPIRGVIIKAFKNPLICSDENKEKNENENFSTEGETIKVISMND
ncbi:predicted protein [Sclerotinia sclerotiorum 1980 UF-70]|uniref:Uncharacterized protein n=1 Tax=Sclerotinia sclerotiorum (strain ATCC 18683 / 1980 / Ss-1) TaxID=665079 RepID=A7E786_SCLS1|nr:predicted protein [Sclerotinia sclerotiorum 1980 UF-70]EDN96238.1 predicted protein [Sclerotinia sclerotiorum 1980 UF-70]